MRWFSWVALGAGALLLLRSLGSYVKKPTNRAGVNALYGDLIKGVNYVEGDGGRLKVDPEWEDSHIVTVTLMPGNEKVRVNVLLADEVLALWALSAQVAGWHPKIAQGYVPRHTMWDPSRSLSLHAYGAALDLDPSKNPYGQKGGELAQHPDWLEVWKDAGWTWGGDWSAASRDEMHLQAAATGA